MSQPSEANFPKEASKTAILKLVAQREHSLLSLMELSSELTVSLDLYGIADLALFNLMGQVGTSKSIFWMIDRAENETVLIRAHGVADEEVRGISGYFKGKVLEEFGSFGDPYHVSDLAELVGELGVSKLQKNSLSVVAPVVARGNLLGIVTLGERISGEPYDDVDILSIRGSMGMLGVAVENARLYGQLVEQHRQLIQANKDMELLDQLKTEFLRNVNHELRTPLTIIIAYIDVLFGEDESRGGDMKPFLETIRGESQKLNELLEELLEFSSLSEDQMEFSFEDTDLVAFIQDYHRERLPGVSESIHELILRDHPTDLEVMCDPRQIKNVLNALVDNAVKFTPLGSKIFLSLSTEEQEDRKVIVFEVEDDGPGIKKDVLEKLFESFQQGDGSTIREVGGLGVGLNYGRKLANEMGGDIEVSSQVGQGATFRLVLPLTDMENRF